MPKASVVVITYNRRDSLMKCLNSLMKQTYKDFEIIVVDGGSTDGTLELIKKYPVKCITEGNGLVKAYNRGWREARGDIVAIIDDDIIATPNWLEEIVKTYDYMNNVGAVGGPQIVIKSKYTDEFCTIEDATKPIPLVSKGILIKIFNAIAMGKKGFKQGQIYRSGYLSGFTLKGDKPIEVDYVNINMSFKREALERANGFDENYNIGHGDYSEPDLCLRIKSLGYKILYNPHALITHEASKYGVTRGIYERTRNFIYFYWKWSKELCKSSTDYLHFVLFLLSRLFFWTYWGAQLRDNRYLGYTKGFIDGLKIAMRRVHKNL